MPLESPEIMVPLIRTRLRPSKLHVGGVGVFAILPIRKDSVIFETCTIPLTDVTAEQIAKLPAPVRKMYTDFAMCAL